MGWLTSVMQACCNQLNDAATALTNLQNACINANDQYSQDATNLVSQQQYGGKGARAFLAEVNTDINANSVVLDGIGHVATALTNFSSAITTRCTTYDTQLAALQFSWEQNDNGYDNPFSYDQFNSFRDMLINGTFENLNEVIFPARDHQDGLAMILVSGSAALPEAYANNVNAVYQTAEKVAATLVSQSVQFYYSPSDQADDAAAVQKDAHDLVHTLSEQILPILTNWADDLAGEGITFTLAVQNAQNYLSARDIYDFIYNSANGVDQGSQSTNKPITITPYQTADGKTALLITISGTDPGHMWDTSVLNAINTGVNGAGDPTDNPYYLDVNTAIATYMSEHKDMEGAEVTFAGYSLGGMVAQLVTNEEAAKGSALAQNNLTVKNVITYGSPIMGPKYRGVNYTLYDSQFDPIPDLSSYVILGGSKDPHNLYASNMHYLTDVDVVQAPGILAVPELSVLNHMHYYQSNQLNSPSTALNINPTTLGPTEYFTMPHSPEYTPSSAPVIPLA